MGSRFKQQKPIRREARQEVYAVLSGLINDQPALDMNHRQLSRLLRDRGINPSCNKGNCIIHESATAISTLKVARPGLTIRRGEASQAGCECQWAYLAGYVSNA